MGRREVVEEILDIQIFSTMNMILKQRLKTNSDEIKDTEYQISLHSEKIELQKKYLAEVIQNKEKLIEEKTILRVYSQLSPFASAFYCCLLSV